MLFRSPSLDRQVAVFVPAEDVLVPYGASNIETAERVTHIMRKTVNEYKKLVASGFYRDLDLGEPVSYHTDVERRKAEDGGYNLTEDNRYAFYEVHANLILDIDSEEDDDEIAKPYVVTIDHNTHDVLAIRRNWDPDDPLILKRNHFVHYVYVPGFGFYGLGLDRKSTRLNSSHIPLSRMPSSA